ncbi:recombinase family protein [candidate division CSSED10-310 bacterium]|uniref:Recombinase family protein n=1 Tax=candidate division CSSED10-310 bacterium TaxID=2855610 RepID=A0ABV6Z2Q5_UNCC1
MNNLSKIKATHLQRLALVYVRQSTANQVEHNRESTERQYKLADRAMSFGWAKEQIKIIDEDMAQSGSTALSRYGFQTMTTDVALGKVGLILSLEVSRVARNNSDWYKVLDLCSMTDTLIGDEDGLYHPGLFNDRLLLGLKGTMAEAELHVIRARLEGGIRNKAAKGELRRGLPVGLVWGEEDGEVLLHPNQAVRQVIQTIFEKFTHLGTVRQVWLWFRSEKLLFPLQSSTLPDIRWVTPTYHAIHSVLTSPVYAGAYVYGKTRQECFFDKDGVVKKRIRKLPRSQWSVCIKNHHQGYISWEEYIMNQARIAKNKRPVTHQASGATREGSALLQGLARCGCCGRRLRIYYQGKNSTPGYYCSGNSIVNGRAEYCMRVGGVRIDEAVSAMFLEAITPAAMEAAFLAEKTIESHHDEAIHHCELQVEQLRYEAEKSERRYRAVEPENRLVSRTLESQWEQCLKKLQEAEQELEQRKSKRLVVLTQNQRNHILSMGKDISTVWYAKTTTARDKKELLQTLIEEITISVDRSKAQAHLIVRWKGGTITEIDVDLRVYRTPPIRTKQDTVDLVRRLAVYYTDATIAGILNRQGRKTATGLRFTADRVASLRRHWKIPRFDPSKASTDGELVTVKRAAEILNMAPSTVHRWLLDGFIGGEQITPGAPWQIRMNEELRARFVEEAPHGYVPLKEAKKILGVSRQTVLHRIKCGKLSAIHVRRGKQRGLYIKIANKQLSLFNARNNS